MNRYATIEVLADTLINALALPFGTKLISAEVAPNGVVRLTVEHDTLPAITSLSDLPKAMVVFKQIAAHYEIYQR